MLTSPSPHGWASRAPCMRFCGLVAQLRHTQGVPEGAPLRKVYVRNSSAVARTWVG